MKILTYSMLNFKRLPDLFIQWRIRTNLINNRIIFRCLPCGGNIPIMVKRQHLYTNELNKTHGSAGFVENFHGAECVGLLRQAGLLEEEKLRILLDQGQVLEQGGRGNTKL